MTKTFPWLCDLLDNKITSSQVAYICNDKIDGLVQDCSNSIANALELLQSCTKPSKWHAKYLQMKQHFSVGQLTQNGHKSESNPHVSRHVVEVNGWWKRDRSNS